MAILKVARLGHPVLRKVAAPVPVSEIRSTETQRLIDDMIETMHEYHGVGLAAPQIHEGLRLFVALLAEEPDHDSQAVAVINPEIIHAEGRLTQQEGCLSLPEFREKVTRPLRVTVRAQDAKGNWFEKTGEELLARALQHETDHLNGRLYIHHISALKRDLIRPLGYRDRTSRKTETHSPDCGRTRYQGKRA